MWVGCGGGVWGGGQKQQQRLWCVCEGGGGGRGAQKEKRKKETVTQIFLAYQIQAQCHLQHQFRWYSAAQCTAMSVWDSDWFISYLLSYMSSSGQRHHLCGWVFIGRDV